LGAILGYAACAPLPKVDPDDEDYNRYPWVMNALSISFDGVGCGTTLARTFNWVCKMYNIKLCSPKYSILTCLSQQSLLISKSK
jgi:hypothetical protein